MTDLRKALADVLADIADYERVNNLAPNSGKLDCWQSVTRARAALSAPPTPDYAAGYAAGIDAGAMWHDELAHIYRLAIEAHTFPADHPRTTMMLPAAVKEHEFSAAAIRALRVPASPWRAISEAPKDGTRILTAYPHFDLNNKTDTPDDYTVMVIKWNGQGWESDSAWMLHADPKVWIPLPSPPTGRATET